MDYELPLNRSYDVVNETRIRSKYNMTYNPRDASSLNQSFFSLPGLNITKFDFEINNLEYQLSRLNESSSTLKNKVWIRIGKFSVNSERLAIAILFTGLLFLFILVIHSWRKEKIKQRRIRQHKIAQQDLPPTYAELMLRKKPPAYKESLMQVSLSKVDFQIIIFH